MSLEGAAQEGPGWLTVPLCSHQAFQQAFKTSFFFLTEMLNSSHMVPYSFFHFSAFIAYIFTFACTHHRLYLCTLTPRVVVYACKQKEIRLLWCTGEHLQPWLLFGCTFLSQSFSVRSCWFRHLLTAASALRATADRHHTEPRRHYGVCVFAGSKCCMWLSIHQEFGVMRYWIRKLFPRSFFQI